MSLLPHARTCQVTNPRDRIYALLSMATDDTDITVDYANSASEVYHALAIQLILRDTAVDILGFTNGVRNLPHLPSWVPDWTHPEAAQPPAEARLDTFWHRVARLSALQREQGP